MSCQSDSEEAARATAKDFVDPVSIGPATLSDNKGLLSKWKVPKNNHRSAITSAKIRCKNSNVDDWNGVIHWLSKYSQCRISGRGCGRTECLTRLSMCSPSAPFFFSVQSHVSTLTCP